MQQFSHFQYLRLQDLDILVDLELSLKLQLKRGNTQSKNPNQTSY
jgi:hypothetical protein